MDEFEECMVRICVELEDLGPDSAVDEGSTAVIDPAALAPKLLAFIEKCVVAHEANQSKKKKKKKPDEDGAKKKGRCATIPFPPSAEPAADPPHRRPICATPIWVRTARPTVRSPKTPHRNPALTSRRRRARRR